VLSGRAEDKVSMDYRGGWIEASIEEIKKAVKCMKINGGA
jgi:hypothetical protein